MTKFKKRVALLDNIVYNKLSEIKKVNVLTRDKNIVKNTVAPPQYMSNKLFKRIFNHYKYFIFALMVLAALSFGIIRSTSLQAENRNIVTVFADGQELVLPSTALTVEELLEKAGVAVFKEDLVEPSLDSQISSSNFNINVYRARPITVIDGNKKSLVLSPYQSPKLVANDAGIKLFDEDIVTLDRIENIVEEGSIGLKMEIKRARKINLDLYGESVEVRTQAKTVQELLNEKQIKTKNDDTIRPAENTKLAGIKKVEVLRNGIQTVTREESVDFGEDRILDSSRYNDYSKVQTPGVKGSKSVTYKINLQNGEEISREKIAEVVLTQPKDAVVVVGTKVRVPEYSSTGGSKEEWMAAAGIPQSQWWAVDFIVTRESSWNPNAVNPNGGACGLAQQLPCGKWDSYGAWNDPVAALRAQKDYVAQRYGGYENAVAFWNINHWY